MFAIRSHRIALGLSDRFARAFDRIDAIETEWIHPSFASFVRVAATIVVAVDGDQPCRSVHHGGRPSTPVVLDPQNTARGCGSRRGRSRHVVDGSRRGHGNRNPGGFGSSSSCCFVVRFRDRLCALRRDDLSVLQPVHHVALVAGVDFVFGNEQIDLQQVLAVVVIGGGIVVIAFVAAAIGVVVAVVVVHRGRHYTILPGDGGFDFLVASVVGW
mmetsp:Transcript_26905/g.59314  ORF Transcript_26905/g.59314 Transcript_26905/m.59314 type:complete len:214 (+) Transcript_26905:493-1134(+)